jgi:hypothetical protein
MESRGLAVCQLFHGNTKRQEWVQENRKQTKKQKKPKRTNFGKEP